MKKIYIVLTNTGTIFSNTIQRYTKVPYNHVSISLNKELTQLYSFGRKFPHNPFIGGFVKENASKGIYSCFPETTCIIYELSVANEQYQDIQLLIKRFEKREHFYTYNLIGLIGVAVNIPIQVRFAYFCSQFVAEVLLKSNIHLFNKPSGLVTPNDFYQYQLFKTIYEGKLLNYPHLTEQTFFKDSRLHHMKSYLQNYLTSHNKVYYKSYVKNTFHKVGKIYKGR